MIRFRLGRQPDRPTDINSHHVQRFQKISHHLDPSKDRLPNCMYPLEKRREERQDGVLSLLLARCRWKMDMNSGSTGAGGRLGVDWTEVRKVHGSSDTVRSCCSHQAAAGHQLPRCAAMTPNRVLTRVFSLPHSTPFTTELEL